MPNTKALVGQVTKIALLAVFNGLFAFLAYLAFLGSQWLIALVLLLVLLAADYVYLSPKFVAAKFLLPGLSLMAIFVIVPIVYTVLMSGFNYKTGNEIGKPEAIEQLLNNGVIVDPEGSTFDMVLGVIGGEPAAILTDQESGEVLVGQGQSIRTPNEEEVKRDQFNIAISVDGFEPWTPNEISAREVEVLQLKFELGGSKYIAPQASDTAAVAFQSLTVSADQQTLIDSVSEVTYRDNGNGNFVSEADDSYLYPGWRAFNPAQNYLGLLTDPVIRGPFLSVFLWTVTFAFTTVLIMFFAGLALALALNKKIRGRNFYRAILILPYAIPSFMSILIWNGMFNRQFGAVNQLLGFEVDWYNDPILAKVVILIVNLWLGFPYFYLISTGALQGLPTDIQEAAAIDGASGRQIFRLIKLPLLLQILSPLLIASFAFNFNNFNLIYLLTAGGPTNVLAGETAGATDILITYAYKTAFGSAEQNLGLASAISVIMFLIVGALSIWSLRRSKVLEGL